MQEEEKRKEYKELEHMFRTKSDKLCTNPQVTFRFRPLKSKTEVKQEQKNETMLRIFYCSIVSFFFSCLSILMLSGLALC